MTKEPAFPGVGDVAWTERAMKSGFVNEYTLVSGMSLRDYFAAAAMQGLLAGCSGAHPSMGTVVHITAYEIADNMLAARDKP